jgi:hypothetical protein
MSALGWYNLHGRRPASGAADIQTAGAQGVDLHQRLRGPDLVVCPLALDKIETPRDLSRSLSVGRPMVLLLSDITANPKVRWRRRCIQ